MKPIRASLTFFILLCVSITLYSQKWTQYYNGVYSFHAVNIDKNDIIWVPANFGWLKYDGGNSWILYDTICRVVTTCVATDADGSVWAAAERGSIYKYDGNELKNFTSSDGVIADCYVSEIKIDSKGNKWFATDKGLMKYDDKVWTCYYKSNGLASSKILSMEIDEEGNIWFGTDNGISVYNDSAWKSYYPSYNSVIDKITDIKQDNNGLMWFTTGSGGILKLTNGTFTRFTKANGLSSNGFIKLIVDSVNNIWAGSYYDGLCKFNGSTWTILNTYNGLPNNLVEDLDIDSKGNIWLLNLTGLYRYGGNSKWENRTFDFNQPCVTRTDNKGNVWFGTDNGALKFDGIQWSLYTTDDGLANNNIRDIFCDDSIIWFGTSGGLSKFNGSDWITYNTANGLVNNDVRCIQKDKKGIYWFATLSGVSRFDGSVWTTYNQSNSGLHSNSISSISSDAYNNKWFGGASGGIAVLKENTWEYYTSGVWQVSCLAEDKFGRIWRGMKANWAGFYNHESWKLYLETSGLVSRYVNSIFIDDQNIKWFCTSDGVSRYDGNSWITYNKASGLISSNVFSTCIDKKGNRWFATDLGISRCADLKPTVNLEVTPIVIPIDGNENSTASMVIESNSAWKITTDGAWLTILKPGGEGNDTVKFRAKANPFSNSRIANIYISANGFDKVEIPIIQNTATKFLAASDPYLYLDSLENSTSLIISSNTDWKVESNQDWLTINKSSGFGNDTIIIKASENSEFDKRYALLTVIGDSIPANQITVEQMGFSAENWYTWVQTVKSPDFGRISKISVNNGEKWVGTNHGVWSFSNNVWKNYTTSDGLVNDTVISIKFNYSTVWIGTNAGASFFNGTVWNSYSTKDGLVNNKVSSIEFFSQDNSVWLGTEKGIGVYKSGIWDTISVSDGLPDSSITCLHRGLTDDLWIGTKKGLAVYNTKTKTFIYYTVSNGLPDNYINSIRKDQNNNMWICTRGGLLIIKGTTWTIYTEKDGLASSNVHDVDALYTNEFITGSSKGLSFFTKGAYGVPDQCRNFNSYRGLPNDTITSIFYDSQSSTHWIGTHGGIFSIYNEQQPTNYAIENGLLTDEVNGTVIDSSGNKWFATSAGVSMFDGIKWTNYTKSDGLPDNQISCITVDKNNIIWIGTFTRGISKFDGTGWINFSTGNSGLAADQITSLAIDSKNCLWVVTRYDGISTYNGSDWTSHRIPPYYNSDLGNTVFDKEGNLWVGCNSTTGTKGLFKFNGTEWTYLTFNDGTYVKWARFLNFDSFGNLWCITGKGLSKYDGFFWNHYQIGDQYYVNGMKIDKNNILWFGGSNVISFDGKTLKKYGLSICWSPLKSIYIDDLNTKWIGTYSGITSSRNEGLTVSRKQIAVDAKPEGSNQFDIKSNVPWTIHTDQEWVIPSVTAGSNNGTINLIVKDNTTAFSRTAMVNITGNRLQSVEIRVTQAAGPAVLTVSTNTLSMEAADSSTSSFTITSNTNWKVSSDHTWLTVDSTSGSMNGTIIAMAATNPSANTRTAKLYVGYGTDSVEITVIQKAATATLLVNADSLFLSASDISTAVLEISSNTTWSLNVDQEWLTVSTLSGSGNASLDITASANLITSPRTANISIAGNGVELFVITVTQSAAPFILSVSADSLDIEAAENSTASLDITSNTTWTLSVDQDWLTVNTLSGSGNGNIILSASANPATTIRSARITASGNGVEPQMVDVQQKGLITGISNILGTEIILLPNPVSDKLWICFSNPVSNAVISVYSLRGESMLSIEYSGHRARIDFSRFPTGLYLLQISVSQRTYRNKVMKF